MEKLQTDDMRNMLDAVDDLRSVGINDIIPLPQIVVCGDQSSGKSSLLEALTGIPFPRDAGLCTRFATQFVLRRAKEVSISVSIIPGTNRTSEEDRKRLEDFGQGKTFEPTKLAELVNEATQVMGLPSLSANPNDRRAFSYDVLSIAISGPDRPSITLVDTPGLIKSKGKFQSAEDIKTIEKLVKSYIDQDSTILLAVLSATYGHELQQIPSMINKAAVRTLGVITKPDGPGSDSALESAYMDLARNQEMPLGHGWHVVKNRSEKEMHFSASERDQAEDTFFSGSKWKDLGYNNIGVPALKERLATLLYKHVQSAIPHLQKSLNEKLEEVTNKLDELGPGRGTVLEHRGLLVDIASKFQRLVDVAVDGNYKKDPFFGMSPRKQSAEIDTDGRRLRAHVQEAHSQFSVAIRRHGSRFNITQTPSEWDMNDNDLLGPATLIWPYNGYASNQTKRTYEEYIAHVHSVEQRFRGVQLSGVFNPDIVDELFHEQSARWSGLAKGHISNVNEQCFKFIGKILSQIAPRDIAVRLVENVRLKLAQHKKEALLALERFLLVERGVLMTYDPEFTATIERIRAKRLERKADEGAKRPVVEPPVASGNFGGSPARVTKVPKLDTKIPIKVDGLAAEDALTVSWVYYRSQREHFIAYLTKHIIEPCMVEALSKVMSPKELGSMTDEETYLLATEDEQLVEERKSLIRKKEILEQGKAKFDMALKKK
ncbi:hypothetical protein D6D17_06549 [Aureobasidium pullulans]|uniref:Dynamin-type G domain-containing protein n=1 Tax=Aureobasidium pullulans TaxID=5580 RepID=A0A4S9BZ65_AURPU|nr:hypothetical protein D6D24_01665 [Aureobasidium pullulans]THW99371.1 hypothetical protein D6D17_06549 [Aureobasidium pullulans]